MLAGFYDRYGHYLGAAALLAFLSVPFAMSFGPKPLPAGSHQESETRSETSAKIAGLEERVRLLEQKVLELDKEDNKLRVRIGLTEIDVAILRSKVVDDNQKIMKSIEEMTANLDEVGRNLTAQVHDIGVIVGRMLAMSRNKPLPPLRSSPAESRHK